MLLDRGDIETKGTVDSVVDRYLNKEMSELTPVINLPNVDGGSPVRNVGLTLFGQDGKPKARFLIFEKWRVVLGFELTESIGHVIAGFGLTTTDGTPITTCWSEAQDLKAGNFEVAFPIDIALASQGLQLNIGISSNERVLFYSEGVGRVEIADVAVGQQPIRSRGTGFLCNSHRPIIHSLNGVKDFAGT